MFIWWIPRSRCPFLRLLVRDYPAIWYSTLFWFESLLVRSMVWQLYVARPHIAQLDDHCRSFEYLWECMAYHTSTSRPRSITIVIGGSWAWGPYRGFRWNSSSNYSSDENHIVKYDSSGMKAKANRGESSFYATMLVAQDVDMTS